MLHYHLTWSDEPETKRAMIRFCQKMLQTDQWVNRGTCIECINYNIVFTLSLPSIMLENSLLPFFSGTSLLKRAWKRKTYHSKTKSAIFYFKTSILKEINQNQFMWWSCGLCISSASEQALARSLSRMSCHHPWQNVIASLWLQNIQFGEFLPTAT